VAEVRVEHGAAQAALVAEDETAAIGELEREAIPPGAVVGVDQDPAGQPQVQPERRAVLGLEPHELPAAVGAGQGVAGERVRELAGGVGAADVGVAIVDRGDPPAERGLERAAGALRFGQLGHGDQRSNGPLSAASAG
jgi:hypothetical protein